ncbi:MAG: hypothetical protein Q8R57_02020 [Bacteroidota bacterium]|nr:hypothetical protein [Bacteroidota bacterium]
MEILTLKSLNESAKNPQIKGSFVTQNLDAPTQLDIPNPPTKLNIPRNISPIRTPSRISPDKTINRAVVWTYDAFKQTGEKGLMSGEFVKNIESITKQGGTISGFTIQVENPNNYMNNLLKLTLMNKFNLTKDQVTIETLSTQIPGSIGGTMPDPDFQINISYNIKERN